MKGYYCLVVFAWFFGALNGQENCIKGNCYNGFGTCIVKNVGEYTGNFSAGKIHGKGVLSYYNGDKYLGHWSNGLRHGKGKMAYSSGNVYLGSFKEDQFHGQGTFTFTNGTQYDGAFEQGFYHGQGRMLFPDGSVYDGSWIRNRREGQGKLTFPDGMSISGRWRSGKYQMDLPNLTFAKNASQLRNCNEVHCNLGEGKYTFSDGSKYYGQFVAGQPSGLGTAIYSDGNRYDGRWRKGLPEGQGVLEYESGAILGAVWKEGVPIYKIFAEGDVSSAADYCRARRVSTVKSDRMDTDQRVKIWAVVIGAADYVHMPLLKYTDDDAYQLYAFLKSPEGGALPDEQLRLLVDEQATIHNINQAVNSVFMRADENDVVLFYFSGHGVQGAFLPIDFDGINNQLKHAALKDMIERSKAKHKIIIADACHSGSLFAFDASPTSAVIRKFYDAFEATERGTAVLMSSKSEEFSLEDGGLRSGIFSHFMIKGLKGEADIDDNGIVTIVELFEFVQHHVVQFTSRVQTPILTGDYDKRLPLAAVRKW